MWKTYHLLVVRYCFVAAMSFQDGAAFFMNYVTAYILLFDIGNLRSGQSLLLHCAGGGVVGNATHCVSFILPVVVKQLNS